MFKIGHSHDIHKLVKGRPLILGGVEIDHDLGLLGHSDADVLCHAITESLIGALGLGDIGKLFPDTSDKYKGISSLSLLEEVGIKLTNLGYEVNNIDSIIFAQKPNMQKYLGLMKENIAKKLRIETSLINIKATTYEKLGPIGEQKAIAAESVCLIKKITKVKTF